MDIGFIAFAVFTHILTKNQFNTPEGTEGRWRTVLGTDQAHTLVLQVAMLSSIVSAGLHAVTVFIGAYLIYMFRKIADLPPDMNPLEDNLTSRSKSKHKYKNSDMSTLIGEDKRFSEISTRDSNRTLCENDPLRVSQMSEKLMGVDNRSSGVSFFQSRDGHASTYSPHNPETARHSWHVSNSSTYQGSIYQHQQTRGQDLSPTKSHQSRASIAESDRYGTSRTMSPMPAQMPRITKRFSATPASPVPIYDESQNSAEDDTNWEVLSGAGSATEDFDPYRHQAIKHQQGTPPNRGNLNRYEEISQQDDSEVGAGKHAAFGLGVEGNGSQPLRMNPPTPEPTSAHGLPASPLARLSQGYGRHEDKENGHDNYERTQTMISQSSASQYSEPEVEQPQQSKSRFYTDLAAAMRGVRHHQPATKAQSVAGSVHTHLSASTAVSGKAVPATQGDLRIKPSGTVVRKPLKSFDDGVQMGYTFAKASPSRVVSRTGVDVVDGDLGMGHRRRDVSGKIAEEGRGGGIWRRISGRMPSR